MELCCCGGKEQHYVHGHYQCSSCGRINDGDCCQGEQENKRAKDYMLHRIRPRNTKEVK